MADSGGVDDRTVQRHPILGFFGGLLAGLGLVLLMLSYSFVPFGVATPWVVLGVLPVAGLAWGLWGPSGVEPPPSAV